MYQSFTDLRVISAIEKGCNVAAYLHSHACLQASGNAAYSVFVPHTTQVLTHPMDVSWAALSTADLWTTCPALPLRSRIRC